MSDKINAKDVGYLEDSLTVYMNLCHAEWHSQKSYMETKDPKWMKIANECRIDRSRIADEFVKEGDGELWCFTKHTALVIVGLVERATRLYSMGKIKEAEENYNLALKWMNILIIKNDLVGGKNV